MSSVNTTQTSMSELSEGSCQRSVHWSQIAEREKGRERQMTEMTKRRRWVGKGQDEKLGGLGFPLHSALSWEHKNAHKPHIHTNIPTHKCWSILPRLSLTAGSDPTLTWLQSIATCGTMEKDWVVLPTFFFCGKAGVWHQGIKPAASHCPCQLLSFSLLLWWRSWYGHTGSLSKSPSLDWIISSGSFY